MILIFLSVFELGRYILKFVNFDVSLLLLLLKMDTFLATFVIQKLLESRIYCRIYSGIKLWHVIFKILLILFPIILLENFASVSGLFNFVEYLSVFMCDIIVYKKKYIFGPHPIPDTRTSNFLSDKSYKTSFVIIFDLSSDSKTDICQFESRMLYLYQEKMKSMLV